MTMIKEKLDKSRMMPLDLSKFPLIGVIHLPKLTWDSDVSVDECINYALNELNKLENANYSGVIIENFNDAPFVKVDVGEEVLAKLSIILYELKKQSKISLGLNILRNGCVSAMKVASTLNLDFIRCNIYEGAYVTDQGIIEGAANKVMEYKKQFGSNVQILADIHVKHATPLGNFPISDAAENALHRGGADAIIVSGSGTGKMPLIKDLEVLSELGIKPLIGSGLTIDNLKALAPFISGAIVGTSIKVDKDIRNGIDENHSKKLATKWNNIFL